MSLNQTLCFLFSERGISTLNGKERKRGEDIKDLLVFEMLIDYERIKSIPLIEQTAHDLYLLHIELI